MKRRLTKGIYVFAIIAVGAFLHSCFGVDNPDVAAGNIYVENDDEGNNEAESSENTGLTIAGDWIEIQGTFASGDDKDFYEIAIDQSIYVDDTTAYKVEFVALNEGEDGMETVGMIMGALYPANIVTYNQDSSVNNILLIGMTPINLTKGDEKMRLYIYGKQTEGDSENLYAGGKKYSLKFK